MQTKYVGALAKSSRALDYVKGRGWSLEVLGKYGVGWDQKIRAITFPLVDEDGEIVGWQRRFIQER